MDALQIEDSRLELAVRAAKEAGTRAESVKHTTAQEQKENGTVVTEADREAEQLIRDILQTQSDHPILGEEYGGDIDMSGTYWVVDPIDGTRNFSYKQPFYGSAVALVEDGEPTVGVFYAPELEYLFYAVSGQGAYRNADRLRVTDEDDVGSAYPNISGKGRTQIYPEIAELTEGAQQTGCALMAEGWVASGWCDIGVIGALAPWDMAVGVVLIREAGGVMKTIADGDTDWQSLSEGRVLFGNEVLADAMRDDISQETVEAVLDAEYDW